MCSAAAVLVAIPLIRRFEDHNTGNSGAGIYLDQLKEVERDRETGLIGSAEADLAKVEIERRLLSAARQVAPPSPVSPLWRNIALAATAGFVVLGAVNLYAISGRPDLPAAIAPIAIQKEVVGAGTLQLPVDLNSAPKGTGDVDGMIAKLAEKMEKNPSDAEGWRMLGWSYFNTQQYDQSAAAYARAVSLSPDNTDYISAYAEAIVQAAGGIVTPKAKELFNTVLRANAAEPRARFYSALALEQAGELAASLDIWIALLGDAPAAAGWVVDVRQHIEDLGKKTDRDTAGILASAPLPKPDTATTLSGADQQAAVDGMIAKLATKLDANPQDRDGWAMMIRSLKVKGDMTGAQAALAQAMVAFQHDPSTRAQIAGLAQSLGITAAASVSTAPEISQQDVATVSAMPADDQQAMIQSMVDRLSEKLSKSPHDADGWVRLIRSRMVLNQPDLARAALHSALTEFASDAATSGQISDSARQLGVSVD
jgi:cytochrome c-type biogenesis protein CcmH